MRNFQLVFLIVLHFWIQVFTEQSSEMFTELFRIICRTFWVELWFGRQREFEFVAIRVRIQFGISIVFSECSAFYSEKFCKFSRILFRKYLYPQLLNSSKNFMKPSLLSEVTTVRAFLKYKTQIIIKKLIIIKLILIIID